jgi:carboxypeptidase C (cathepsin A)
MRPWIRIVPPCLALVLLSACGGSGDSGGVVGGGRLGVSYSAAPSASLPGRLEDAAISSHEITLGGAPIPYTATAGHLTAVGPDDGQPEAAMFYVAYTADGADPSTRPLTFLYNGGPGSASVWLHLGSFGPKRLVTGDPATTGPLPFPLVDNPDSLLDTTDLVFVDAVGTGLSEAIAPNTNQTFWGVDADAAVFRDFITCYLNAAQRQASPLYLFGESYGTPRSAVLANLLGAARIMPAGVILQSSVLDYNANGDMLPKVSCAGYLPSYAALGAYYQLDSPAPPDLTDFIQQMRVFTHQSYGPAVDALLADQTAPDPGLPPQLQADTGLTAHLWQQQFNLLPETFRANLVPGTLIGRYDGRVSAPVGSPLAADGDPSSTWITAPFTAAINSYLTDFLGYDPGSDYTVLGQAGEYWDFSHDGLALPDTIPDLQAAVTRDPTLKLLSLNGYHDLATPFYQTELDLARMGAQPTLQIRHYDGGHMIYLDDASLSLEKTDLAAFYAGAPGWTGSPDHGAVATRIRRFAAPSARPGPALALGKPLADPYVPPAQRHPRQGPATTGEALKAQVARKLAAPSAPGQR